MIITVMSALLKQSIVNDQPSLVITFITIDCQLSDLSFQHFHNNTKLLL